MPIDECLLRGTFRIESQETFDCLFAEAELFFADKAPGTKVYRIDHSIYEEGEVPPGGHIETPSSFLKINDPPYILMLASGSNRVLGKGGFGSVKLAVDRDGHFYAVKRYTAEKNILQRINVTFFKKEHAYLTNLCLGLGEVVPSLRTIRVKNYSVQYFLGQTLTQFLRTHSELSFESRMKLAIAICFKLHQLHSGLLSQTGIGYSHFDLKPENITVYTNEDGTITIHFIDFGSASPINEKFIPEQRLGSLVYLPVDACFLNDSAVMPQKAREFVATFGKGAYDLVSIKRVIYFFSQLTAYLPDAFSILREEDIALLPENIEHLLNTSEVGNMDEKETSLFLAAVLANQLQPEEERHPIAALYDNPHEQTILVKSVLSVNEQEACSFRPF